MKVSVFVATSVDGYIARRDGGLDWLPDNGETFEREDHGFGASMATIDALVIGRHSSRK